MISHSSQSKILKNVPVLSPSEAMGGDVKVEEPEKMTLAMFDVKNLLENDDEDLNDHQQETRRLSMIRSSPLRF